MINIDLLSFLSSMPIDRILHHGTVSIYNPGPTADEASNNMHMIDLRIPNPVGKPCFVRARWNIGGAWQDLSNKLEFLFYHNAAGFSRQPQVNTLAEICVGVSNSEIVFRTGNGHHSDIYQDTPFGEHRFTPYPHTFTIEYVLFDM